MKKNITILLLTTLSLCVQAQTQQIHGVVTDGKKEPLAFVNVYIEETLDGTTTKDDGSFILETDAEGVVNLKASFIGYETFSMKAEVSKMKNLQIKLKPAVELLQDVVIVAGNYSLKSSTLENQNAIDLITTGGSDGDLYKSLTMLPGTQAPGVDGRLQVRGGESRESQTFIDGMHVLSPYTASTPDSPSRSKYSPFHFDGINFSTGGYSPEYSQSLSSILPLETKNSSTTKYGMQLMNVNVEAGGTQAWDGGSASITAGYTDLTFYNATLHPGENDNWDIPYRDFSLRNQLRFNLDKNSVLKTYYGFDKTRFKHLVANPFTNNVRNMDYDENNVYLNNTFHKKFVNNINFFAGAAYSWNQKSIANSLTINDQFGAKEHEIHLKAKASKRFTNLYKLEVGAETYLKSYDMSYSDEISIERKVNNNISGAFVSNDFNFTSKFFLNLSGRLEYSTLTKKYSILPRAALNYQLDGLTVSAIVGKYQQSVDKDYLVYNEHLPMETNTMAMLGLYYSKNKRIYRAEIYNKKYHNLPLILNGNFTSGGNGYSRGLDLYIDDRKTFRNFEYMITYSLNDTKRKYLDYPEKATPDFVTKHNASITLKYTNIPKLKSIFSITNYFASGRPYHDPNKDGFMNSKTPFYHTLDVALTVLPHRKVVLYACLSNVLNRNNIYGYESAAKPDMNGKFAMAPVLNRHNRAFYIGVFITLGKNVAYEASYF